MPQGGTRRICIIYLVANICWVGSVPYNPARPLTTAGEEPDDLDHDISDLSVPNVQRNGV